MRLRLRKLLPIMLMALAVQIVAPVVACWTAVAAVSDPLHGAVICHGDMASGSGPVDPAGVPATHEGCCSVCSISQTGAPIQPPLSALAALSFRSEPVLWPLAEPDCIYSRAGLLAQARAPPY
jgi:Protein of unknown function (DUF2946)